MTVPIEIPATSSVPAKATLFFVTAVTLLNMGLSETLLRTYDIISPILTRFLKSATPPHVIVPVELAPEPLAVILNSSPGLNGPISPLNSVLPLNTLIVELFNLWVNTDLTSENSKSVETPTLLPISIPFFSSGSFIWKFPFVL